MNMRAGGFSLSPDGKPLAFIASLNEPINSYTEPDLWVMDLTPGAKPRNVTRDFDYDVASGAGGDNTAPRAGGGTSPAWSADGRSIFEVYAKEGKRSLGAFEVATGRETEVLSGIQAVVSLRAV